VTPNPEKSTSSARIAANRQNAQHSTGPRTPEGKARSSQNAVTHGVFSTSSQPISAGLFAEDPALIDAYIDGIVAGLSPRDAAEQAQAHIVANTYLRGRRLSCFEAAGLSSAGTVPASEQRRLAQEIRDAQEHWDGFEDLRSALTGMDGDPDCEQLIKFIEKHQTAARDATARLWRDQLPETPEEWRDALLALVTEVRGPDNTDAIEWVERELIDARHSLGVLEGRALAGAAERSLQMFDRVTVYATRLSLVLERALRDYRQLQTRPLTSPDTPTSSTKSPKRVLSTAEISARETNPTSGNPPAT